jgi:hypothetical protein
MRFNAPSDVSAQALQSSGGESRRDNNLRQALQSSGHHWLLEVSALHPTAIEIETKNIRNFCQLVCIEI